MNLGVLENLIVEGGILSQSNGFFNFILDGHFYLWLPHEIGQTLKASATLVLLLLLITGFMVSKK